MKEYYKFYLSYNNGKAFVIFEVKPDGKWMFPIYCTSEVGIISSGWAEDIKNKSRHEIKHFKSRIIPLTEEELMLEIL